MEVVRAAIHVYNHLHSPIVTRGGFYNRLHDFINASKTAPFAASLEDGY